MKQLKVFILLFVLCCMFSSIAEARCTKDTDCKGNRICDKGVCVNSNIEMQNSSSSINKMTKIDLQKEKLLMDIHDLKKSQTMAKVGMGLGYGFGIGFLVGGGLLYSAVDNKTVPIILLAGGGIEIILGVVATAIYFGRKGKIEELENKLYLSNLIGLKDKQIQLAGISPFIQPDNNGSASYGLALSGRF